MASRVSGSEDVIFISEMHFLKEKHLLAQFWDQTFYSASFEWFEQLLQIYELKEI